MNYIGLAAGFLAFISLPLPWWTMTMSQKWMPTFNGNVLLYLYCVEASAMGQSQAVIIDLWFCLPCLIIILLAGVVSLVGSALAGKVGKTILMIAGVLALFSTLIFAVGLHVELSKGPLVAGFPQVSLFSSGSSIYMGIPYMIYSTYPTFGFWLGLASGILALVSSLRHPIVQECSLCKKQIVKIWRCPKCKLIVCASCAVDNHWKCPECKEDLVKKKVSEEASAATV